MYPRNRFIQQSSVLSLLVAVCLSLSGYADCPLFYDFQTYYLGEVNNTKIWLDMADDHFEEGDSIYVI